MHLHDIWKHIFKQLSYRRQIHPFMSKGTICTIVTKKVEDPLDILDHKPMIYEFELIE